MLRRLVVLFALAPLACATTSAEVRTEEAPANDPTEWAPFPAAALKVVPPPGAKVAEWAARLEGLASLKGVSTQVPDECTGFARLAYWQVGTELLGPESHPRDNGVTAIYRHAEAAGALHWHSPSAGDLVFFVETYDRNRDGKRNDGLTHVGVVESVDPDGTVVFLHRVSGGVRRSRLNVRHPQEAVGPNGERWNEVLRTASRKLRAYLTGELFSAFASADRLVPAAAGSGLTARP